ncbi:PT domain-containing protein [Frankia sp. CiP1_Cm_nod1]|uniref:PT domain-containing protein n=2 Tax=unclassified Frankia TaxID=2632575 RepID=UPI002023EF53
MARTIRINGIDVPVIADEMTGADIKAAAGVGDDRVLVRQETDRNTIISDDHRVRVADGDVFAHHARHSKAMPGARPAATGPLDKPAGEPVDEPTGETAGEPTGETAGETADRPAGEPADGVHVTHVTHVTHDVRGLSR